MTAPILVTPLWDAQQERWDFIEDVWISDNADMLATSELVALGPLFADAKLTQPARPESKESHQGNRTGSGVLAERIRPALKGFVMMGAFIVLLPLISVLGALTQDIESPSEEWFGK